MTKREWQIEMANRFAKSDKAKIGEWQIEMAKRFAKSGMAKEQFDTRSYLIGRYDSTKTLTDEEISAVWASKKYDGEHFVDYIEFARDLLRKAQEK